MAPENVEHHGMAPEIEGHHEMAPEIDLNYCDLISLLQRW
jgi:hypothetical protein